MWKPAPLCGVAILAGALGCGGRAEGATMDVGGRKQLFIDRRFIAEWQGVSLEMHPPVKQGVVLRRELPSEAGRMGPYGSVARDGDELKMWYWCQERRDIGKGRLGLGLALSRDGRQWTKPTLGLAERGVGAVCHATQRLDGFVSAHARAAGGYLVTPPLTFSGSRLELNVATTGGGSCRAELQDAAGEPLPGYALGDCDPIRGDDVARVVTWRGHSDVSALAGRRVRVRLQMSDADVYAFQFMGAGAP